MRGAWGNTRMVSGWGLAQLLLDKTAPRASGDAEGCDAAQLGTNRMRWGSY